MPVEISAQLLTDLLTQVAEMDEKLDQSAGSETAAKKIVANKLIEQYKTNADEVTASVHQMFDEDIQNDDQFLAVVVTLQRVINENDERVKKIWETKSDEIKSALVKLSPEEQTKLTNDRKELVKEFRGLKEVLKMFPQEWEVAETIKEPKRRWSTGRGKRGARKISLYTWSVDGTRQPAASDSLSGVASENGYDKYKTLADAMRADIVGEDGTVITPGINLTEPPDEITFTMKNGKVLTGVKKAQDTEEDDDDESDDDESDDSPEESEETSASNV